MGVWGPDKMVMIHVENKFIVNFKSIYHKQVRLKLLSDADDREYTSNVTVNSPRHCGDIDTVFNNGSWVMGLLPDSTKPLPN